jgi:hypothetical protein
MATKKGKTNCFLSSWLMFVPGTGMVKNQDPGLTSWIRNTANNVPGIGFANFIRSTIRTLCRKSESYISPANFC